MAELSPKRNVKNLLLVVRAIVRWIQKCNPYSGYTVSGLRARFSKRGIVTTYPSPASTPPKNSTRETTSASRYNAPVVKAS
jgi:hypothetical protein